MAGSRITHTRVNFTTGTMYMISSGEIIRSSQVRSFDTTTTGIMEVRRTNLQTSMPTLSSFCCCGVDRGTCGGRIRLTGVQEQHNKPGKRPQILYLPSHFKWIYGSTCLRTQLGEAPGAHRRSTLALDEYIHDANFGCHQPEHIGHVTVYCQSNSCLPSAWLRLFAVFCLI